MRPFVLDAAGHRRGGRKEIDDAPAHGGLARQVDALVECVAEARELALDGVEVDRLADAEFGMRGSPDAAWRHTLDRGDRRGKDDPGGEAGQLSQRSTPARWPIAARDGGVRSYGRLSHAGRSAILRSGESAARTRASASRPLLALGHEQDGDCPPGPRGEVEAPLASAPIGSAPARSWRFGSRSGRGDVDSVHLAWRDNARAASSMRRKPRRECDRRASLSTWCVRRRWSHPERYPA